MFVFIKQPHPSLSYRLVLNYYLSQKIKQVNASQREFAPVIVSTSFKLSVIVPVSEAIKLRVIDSSC